ncbi:TorD/DmsD family molecular chaperone [Sansalvadorimonas verongulae]|uniref:TorD/DmsD family molecular chaperone n=1 Tax=Sansalvadorimonas verongulae TaxID=2172824 RepID=UPI0012BBE3D1|nr:molecular chaperone TorD family protein [Sansalvadorimonas verongulae]MTI15349.1 cytoplasmic chaperone TorD family protein [Sansalvadorimonas verongulae]
MTEQQLHQMAGLHIASQFFYRFLHQAPDAELIQALQGDGDVCLLDHWPVELNDEDQQALAIMKAGLDTHLSELSQDYADLFVGPNALLAAPWGSVYLTEDQANCGQPTLQVKAFYREYGVEIDTGENEPDDHIGLMFAFLAHLTEQGLQAAGNGGEAEPWITAAKAFLEHHILTWAPRFLTIMGENARSDFYKGGSLLCKATLDSFAELTGAQFKIVKLYR